MNTPVKQIIILIVVVIVLAGGAWWYFSYSKNTPTGTNEPGRYMNIESYVKNNISELSPEKEVLGGKFYVTGIKIEGGFGTVNYEDGHNAFIADFTYTVDTEGKLSITSFTVKK